MSSPRLCRSCDRPLRRGSSRRALVLDAHGEVRSGLVCSRCALRAVAFVIPPPTTLAPACTHCKRAPASICACCAKRTADHVRELAAANVALATKGGDA